MGMTGAALAWAVAVITPCTLSLVQTRVTMKVVSLGPAAAVVALANVICFGVPLVVLGRFAAAGIGTLALALIACVPGVRTGAQARPEGADALRAPGAGQTCARGDTSVDVDEVTDDA